MLNRNLGSAVLVVLSLTISARAVAVELLTNGDFEAAGGSFTGWTKQTPIPSGGDWFIQQGTSDNVAPFSVVPAPPGGTHAAMTDTNSPGSHVLYQNFTIPAVVPQATLQFSRYINQQNTSVDFASPATLDAFAGFPDNVVPNQQVRVDIIKTSSSAVLSVSPSDVFQNIYQSQPGDPHVSGYTVQTVDVTALLASRAGQTLRLRFAEADNLGTLLFGIDQVSLVVTPEPSACLLGAFALVGLTAAAWRKRRKV
jgi:hypothetical protein